MCRTAAPARLSSPSLLPLLPLQLHDLHSQLTALSQQGAVTLGLNPNTVPRPAAPELRSPSPPPPQQRAASPTAASGKSASPVRNSFSLAGWGSSQSPQRAARSPSLAPLRVVVDGAADGEEQPRSPALVYAQRAHECKEQAAAASQHVDAELRQSGSPGRLARLFGRVHLGGGGGHGSSNGSPARGSTPEATYELLLPPPPPQQQQCNHHLFSEHTRGGVQDPSQRAAWGPYSAFLGAPSNQRSGRTAWHSPDQHSTARTHSMSSKRTPHRSA